MHVAIQRMNHYLQHLQHLQHQQRQQQRPRHAAYLAYQVRLQQRIAPRIVCHSSRQVYPATQQALSTAFPILHVLSQHMQGTSSSITGTTSITSHRPCMQLRVRQQASIVHARCSTALCICVRCAAKPARLHADTSRLTYKSCLHASTTDKWVHLGCWLYCTMLLHYRLPCMFHPGWSAKTTQSRCTE